MTGRILIIVHQETSTPGRIGHELRAMGYSLDIRRPCLGDPLPPTRAHQAGAVIFGGPMSANDPDAYLKQEIDWIGVPLREEKPFLGVCLGAQMLSKHLGGVVGPHPDGDVEIGYCPIRPDPAGAAFGPWPAQVYQWHREGLTLPRDALRLATGDTYENQAFRLGTAAYGIQFHPEVTRLTMHRWVVSGAHRFVLKGAQPGWKHLADNLSCDAPVAEWLKRFLGVWLKPASSPV